MKPSLLERGRRSVSALSSKARNNPDYAGAVLSGYGFVLLQILLQVFLIPFYLSTLGTYLFGLLMIVFGIVTMANWGIRWLQGSVLVAFAPYAARNDVTACGRLGASLYLGIAGFTLIAVATAIPALEIMASREVTASPDGAAAWQGLSQAQLCAGLASYLLCQMGLTVELWILVAMRRQVLTNTLNVVSLLVSVSLVIIWLSSDGGLPGVMGCLAAGSATGWALAIFARRKRLHIVVRPTHFRGASARFRKEIIGRSGGAFFAYGMLVLLMSSDVPLIGFLLGPAATTQFVLSWKVAEVAVLLLWRMVDHLKPEIIMMQQAGQRDRLFRVYGQTLTLIRILAAAAGLGYGILGRWVVGLWVGVDRAPTNWWPYALAGLSLFWLATAYVPDAFAYSLGWVGRLARLKAVEVLAKLVVLVAVLRWAGPFSPMLAVGLVHLSGVALAYIVLGRHLMADVAPKA